MKGIILASHGHLADGMLDTLKLFNGEIEQIETLCLLPEEDVSKYSDELEMAVNKVNTGDGVVIFCDLLFGTPCNCSARLLKEFKSEEINIITGMNLPMVMEYLGARNSDMNSSDIVLTGQNGIVDFKKLLSSQNK